MGCVGAAAGGDFCSEFRSWVLGVGVLASEWEGRGSEEEKQVHVNWIVRRASARGLPEEGGGSTDLYLVD